MRSPTTVAILLPTTLGCAGQSLAAGELSVTPPWEARPAQRFTTDAGVLYADGRPFPLLYEFTWSAPHDPAFFRYFSQFLGTSHWESFSLNLEADFNRETIDRVYDAAAGERIYVTLSPSVQHCAYPDPESFAVTADGERSPRGTRSFLHEGYRQALAAKLAELAQYVRDKPCHMGWYPQDEYAYRAFSGFEECSLAVFRERMIERYGGLEGLNEAWGTEYRAPGEIDPPHAFERSVRFADWQEFRRWAQTDFTRFVYQTLKEADPGGTVIWSLPFWGSWTDAAGWWDLAEYSDVLMRHGIGYATGIYRLAILRAVSTWSGKPANALCMPPDYNPTYVQMGFLLEGPPTGLSHVCVGGAAEHTYYQGAADSENAYKRKEPMYTGSRSLNGLVRYLGPTFLQAKSPPAKVGVFVSDRTVLLNGTDLNRLNGILLLLSDLNVDYEVFAEPNLGNLSRFGAIFAGQYSQCSSPETAEQFAAFARSGGLLTLSTGAFSADWYNRPLEANPGFALAELVGGEEIEQRQLAEPLEVVAKAPAYPDSLPTLGDVSLREANGAEVIAATADGMPAITRKENVVFLGVDPGLVYQKGYTDDFAGVAGSDDKQVIDEFAGFDFGATEAQLQAEQRQPHRAFARLVQALLSEKGVSPTVQVDGPGKATGAIRARALVNEDDTIVGLANRVVLPGRDHQQDPPQQYHQVHENLTVRVATDPSPRFAIELPMARVEGRAAESLPRELAITQGTGWTSFVLPRLADVSAVLLTSDYPPLLGIGLEDRVQTRSSQFDVKVHVLNPSRQRASGEVRLDVAPPLKAFDSPKVVGIASRGQINLTLRAEVPPETDPGYYLVQAVGEFGDDEPRVSPSLEVEVARDLELHLADLPTSLFPDEDRPSSVRVSGRTGLGRDASLTARLVLPEGFEADAIAKPFALPADGSERSVEFAISATTEAAPVAECKLVVEGDVRGVAHREEATYRLARGVVGYRQHKSVRMGAAESSRRDVDLVCLENSRVKATFYPVNGVLHELFHRPTGTDCLGKGDYPFGAVWYSGPGPQFVDFERTAEKVVAVFRGSANGVPLTMSATLERDSNFVRVDWDCGDAPPISASYYVMSRLSLGGQADLVTVPLAAGTTTMDWSRRQSRTVALGDLAVPALAVQNPEADEVFVVGFRDIPFDEVSLETRSASHNYMIFRPGEGKPGRFTFWFGVAAGAWDNSLAAIFREK